LPWRADGWGIRDADDIPIAEASPEVASAVVVLVNGAMAVNVESLIQRDVNYLALTKRYSDHIFDGDSMCCEVCLDIADATTGGHYWCRSHVPETIPDLAPGWTIADVLVWRLAALGSLEAPDRHWRGVVLAGKLRTHR
jgi:hypothetical protein